MAVSTFLFLLVGTAVAVGLTLLTHRSHPDDSKMFVQSRQAPLPSAGPVQAVAEPGRSAEALVSTPA